MKIIQQSSEILEVTPNYLKLLEKAGRTCYKSEDKINDESAELFIKKIVEMGHESVLEHGNMTVKFITDRGVTHELVRHRVASFSQESTRYCNYAKGKFGSQITLIKPAFWYDNDAAYNIWVQAMENAEKYYFDLLMSGATAQEARTVLPNSLKAEIIMTANFREWRHIFRLRCSEAAHIQIRDLMIKTLEITKKRIPIIFDDLSFSL